MSATITSHAVKWSRDFRQHFRGYQQLLSVVQQTKAILDRMTRFDMPDFVPSEHYIREMKRYGFVPKAWEPGDAIDVDDLDRAYGGYFGLIS